jgi:hypothetical protein
MFDHLAGANQVRLLLHGVVRSVELGKVRASSLWWGLGQVCGDLWGQQGMTDRCPAWA